MQDESIAQGGAASRLNRRTLLKGTAAAGAAVALGPISKRSTFAAPAFLQGTNIVLALTNDDAPKVQPLLDDYSKKNNVSIEVQQNPYAGLQQKLTLALTQGTGDYDVVSMDDPWMPQFAGGKFRLEPPRLSQRFDSVLSEIVQKFQENPSCC